MPPRLHVDAPLAAGDAFTLPAGAILAIAIFYVLQACFS